MILIQIIVNNFLYKNFYICITNFVIVVSEHADLMPSEDAQIESRWMVLTIIL
jgi:hypothetical protein